MSIESGEIYAQNNLTHRSQSVPGMKSETGTKFQDADLYIDKYSFSAEV